MSAPESFAVPFRAEKGAMSRAADAREGKARLREWLVAAGRTLVAVLLAAGTCIGVLQAARFAAHSPAFAVREVRFTGLLHARAEELVTRSGVRVGQNLLRTDLAAAARGVEAHPWVASARVHRSLFPPSVVIDVDEHRAAALVQLSGLYAVDTEGRVFKRAMPDDGLDLPLLTGLRREEWHDARGPSQQRVLLALELIADWRREGLPASALSEVRLDSDGGLTAFAKPVEGAPMQEIKLGSTGFGPKLQKLSLVWAALQRRGEAAVRVDLDNQGRPGEVAAQLARELPARRTAHQ